MPSSAGRPRPKKPASSPNPVPGSERFHTVWRHAMSDRHVTLFHCPQTRSSGALLLLEELQADYRLHVLNMKAGEHRQPAYLAINPMGKVPAVLHGDALVTEQVAIFIYLADLYPEAGLAPALGDPLRGPYLRWMAYYPMYSALI
eukprot:Opistho-1_new@70512